MEGYGSVSGWSIEDWRKTWEGIVVVNRRGRAKVNGGHGFGKGWPGKTEFPERWTFADMQYATMLTWHDPHVVRESGDCQYARRVVDRVLMEVQAYGPGYTIFRASFPVNGDGVVKNVLGDKVEIPLDLAKLKESGWKHVRHGGTC